MSKNLMIAICLILCAILLYAVITGQKESNEVYEGYREYRAKKQAEIKVLVDQVSSLDSEVVLQSEVITSLRDKNEGLQKELGKIAGKIKRTDDLLSSTREELLEQNRLKDEAIFKCFELNASLVAETKKWEGLVVTLKKEVDVLKKLNFEQNDLWIATNDALETVVKQNERLKKQNRVMRVGGIILVAYVAIKIIGG